MKWFSLEQGFSHVLATQFLSHLRRQDKSRTTDKNSAAEDDRRTRRTQGWPARPEDKRRTRRRQEDDKRRTRERQEEDAGLASAARGQDPDTKPYLCPGARPASVASSSFVRENPNSKLFGEMHKCNL